MIRARGLLAPLVLLAAALVVALALGEVLSRAFNLVDRVNGFPRRLFVVTDDPHLPYVMRPGVDTVVRGFHVTVNEHGLRGPSFATRPAPGVHRVLALGDSATFGEGLAVEEAFPALLERELAARTGERWEVLNAGVEGYNTEAELAYLRQRGLAFAPETVVVGFNLNDFDYAPVMGPLGILTTDQTQRVGAGSLGNRSEFYLLLRWLVRTRARSWIDDRAVKRPEGTREFLPYDVAISRQRKDYYRAPNDSRWQTLADSLRGLGDAAREDHLRLVVAIIPDGDQVGVPDPDLVPQERLGALCTAAAIDCLDLYPRFAAAIDGGTLYFDIMHPNAAGHRLIAHELAERLAR